ALASFSNQSDSVFLSAPGVDIDASDANGVTADSGTSASSAIVAGAAALMRANDPSASNATIIGRLARNADPVSGGNGGNGRLNLERAINDTSTDGVTPAGSDAGGGPFVGPYHAAATITWDGSSSANWSTGANWSSGTVPTSSDTVVIGNSAN